MFKIGQMVKIKSLEECMKAQGIFNHYRMDEFCDKTAIIIGHSKFNPEYFLLDISSDNSVNGGEGWYWESCHLTTINKNKLDIE